MWNNWCTKYNSYSATNDVQGMLSILNQIISSGFATNLQTAFTTLQGRCLEGGFTNAGTWTFPGSGGEQRYLCENGQCYQNAQGMYSSLADCQANCEPNRGTGATGLKDCYKCDEQIMNRVSASTPCPEGWVGMPVNPQTGLSQNPCPKKDRVVGVGGFQRPSGRIRAGIKQPEFYTNPVRTQNREFNIFEKPVDNTNSDVNYLRNVDRKPGIIPITPTNPGVPGRDKPGVPPISPTNPDGALANGRNGNILVVNGEVRIGSSRWVTDANGQVMQITKERYSGDNPVYTDPATGQKVQCTGRCKIRIRRFGLLNDTKVKAPCRYTNNGCKCAGYEC